METTLYKSKTIGEIVTEDFRTAEIFKSFGIDFCCGGNQTIEEACSKKKIDIKSLEDKLNSLNNTPKNEAHNFSEWDLGFLCDYIQNTHHKLIKRVLPQLQVYTKKIASVHGMNHNELIEIYNIFSKLSNDLGKHLKEEEEILFPAIKEYLKTKSPEAKKIINDNISGMIEEHKAVGAKMDKINELSDNYRLPIDACNTYSVTFNLLNEFEDDLHIHVHLENNIMYPKALTL